MEVLDFFFKATQLNKKKAWDNQELSELYRIHEQLLSAGFPVAAERGDSDEGDPWFVFVRGDTDEVIVHFARIDGRILAVNCITGETFSGGSFRLVIDEMMASVPAAPRRRSEGNVVLHPRMVMMAFVASAFLTMMLQAERAEAASPEGDEAEDGAPQGSAASQLAVIFRFLQRDGEGFALTSEQTAVGSLALVAMALLTIDLQGVFDEGGLLPAIALADGADGALDPESLAIDATSNIFTDLDLGAAVMLADDAPAGGLLGEGLVNLAAADLVRQEVAPASAGQNQALDATARIALDVNGEGAAQDGRADAPPHKDDMPDLLGQNAADDGTGASSDAEFVPMAEVAAAYAAAHVAAQQGEAAAQPKTGQETAEPDSTPGPVGSASSNATKPIILSTGFQDADQNAASRLDTFAAELDKASIPTYSDDRQATSGLVEKRGEDMAGRGNGETGSPGARVDEVSKAGSADAGAVSKDEMEPEPLSEEAGAFVAEWGGGSALEVRSHYSAAEGDRSYIFESDKQDILIHRGGTVSIEGFTLGQDVIWMDGGAPEDWSSDVGISGDDIVITGVSSLIKLVDVLDGMA